MMRMTETLPLQERVQTTGEEIANSISHGVGVLAALVVAPFLIIASVQSGSAAHIVGVSIFAVTVVLMYSASMLYHALPAGKAKRVFKVLDHGAIFLLIAGTYTPFTLGVLFGAWGWTLFGLVWGLAVIGIAMKGINGASHSKISTFLYLAMGWLIVIAIKPLWLNMPFWGLFWLIAGGMAYTLGVGFFVTDKKLRYGHFIWHMFVLAGTACHCVAVLWYSA